MDILKLNFMYGKSGINYDNKYILNWGKIIINILNDIFFLVF